MKIETTPVTLNLSTVWLKTHQVITVFHCILSNTLAGIVAGRIHASSLPLHELIGSWAR